MPSLFLDLHLFFSFHVLSLFFFFPLILSFFIFPSGWHVDIYGIPQYLAGTARTQPCCVVVNREVAKCLVAKRAKDSGTAKDNIVRFEVQKIVKAGKKLRRTIALNMVRGIFALPLSDLWRFADAHSSDLDHLISLSLFELPLSIFIIFPFFAFWFCV